MEVEKRLIPVLREGVEAIKMVFFKKLKTHLARKHPRLDSSRVNKLCGAVVNDLFGTPNTAEPFATFAQENKALIEGEARSIAVELQEMRIPLTDALRIQFLCDHQEGMDSSSVLQRAKELDILLVDREVPLPAKFMTLVRKLGTAFNLLSHRS